MRRTLEIVWLCRELGVSFKWASTLRDGSTWFASSVLVCKSFSVGSSQILWPHVLGSCSPEGGG